MRKIVVLLLIISSLFALFSCETGTPSVQTKENTVQINQLSKDKNDALIGFLNKVAKDTENNEFLKIIDINNYIVTEILTDLTQRSNTNPVLGNGTFSLILK